LLFKLIPNLKASNKSGATLPKFCPNLSHIVSLSFLSSGFVLNTFSFTSSSGVLAGVSATFFNPVNS
jgi:hypothetical protein